MVGDSMQVFRYPPCPRVGFVDTPTEGVQCSYINKYSVALGVLRDAW